MENLFILIIAVIFVVFIEVKTAKTRKAFNAELLRESEKRDADLSEMQKLSEEIKKFPNKRYSPSQVENIYRGLVLAFNQEKSVTRKAEIQLQIKEIEKTNLKIEF